jgi:Ca2+-transporting ATPase
MASATVSPPTLHLLRVPCPGRVRLAVGTSRPDPTRAVAIERALAGLPGVARVRLAPRTGTVLVEFDPARYTPLTLLQAAADALGLRNGQVAEASPAPGLRVCSAVPGRLRVAVPGLRGAAGREAWVASVLARVEGVTAVSASARTGTALVRYQPARWTPTALVAALATALARTAPPGAPAPHGTPAPAEAAPWHAWPAPRVLARLGVDPGRGLSPEEVRRRQAHYGLNRLPEPAPPSFARLLAEQFANAPSALLAASTAVAVATGALLEAALIAGVLVVNAAVGALTERSGQRAIQALRRGLGIRARVRRGGVEQLVDAEELVPGDVLVLLPGDPVPADARLLAAERLRVEEAALTGESRPVAKDPAPVAATTPLADRRDMVLRGTTVLGGHGTAVVVATGEHTAYGQLRLLAARAAPPPTPLERDLATLGRAVAVGATAICAGVFGLSVWRGASLGAALHTAIGLGVAAIPEALPTVATTVLAFGSGRMRRKGTLIRTLAAAEALGAVTHVCADKTGTLTENRMAVRELYVEDRAVQVTGPALAPTGRFLVEGAPISPAAWPALAEALTIGVLNSDAHLVVGPSGALTIDGSATEGALLVAAVKAGLAIDELRAAHPLCDRRDRDATRRHLLTVHRTADGPLALVKGSPEEVLALCDRVLLAGREEPLTDALRAALAERNAAMAGRAMRVLALARRALPSDYTEADLEAGFTWVGLVGLVDPIRPGVPAAIQALHRAGIRTIMITGDQAPTAVAVARELQLSRRGSLAVLEADELARLAPAALRERVREVGIFARVPPELKLAIVRALQANGKIVAMTGDGVNDAPALRAADVGIAMGERGTELARELADVVLATDDFARIVDAVEEGRLVRANVRRVVHYLLATNAAEVWAVAACAELGWPAPLAPLQLLWLNLVTDLAPALALAVEPRDPTLLEQPPRDPQASFLPRPFLLRLLGESGVLALAALGAFALGLRRYGPGPQAQTMAFTALVGAQILHAPLARVYDQPALLARTRPNRWLALALLASAGLQLAALLLPPLRAALGGAALRPGDLLAAAAWAGGALAALEGERWLRRLAPHAPAG